MDLFSIVYAFMMSTGAGTFVINDAQEVAAQVLEVDVESSGLYEDKRYILLIDHGIVTQHVQVPLTSKECANPN